MKTIRLGVAMFPSAQLSVSDSSYFHDDPVLVPLEPGPHDIEIEVDDSRSAGGVNAVRICARVGQRGRVVGTFGVDFGQVCFCDRGSAEAAFELLGDAGMVELHDALEVDEDAVVVRVGGCELFLVRPARGDGRYAVRELVDSEGRRCGVEVDFAEDAA